MKKTLTFQITPKRPEDSSAASHVLAAVGSVSVPKGSEIGLDIYSTEDGRQMLHAILESDTPGDIKTLDATVRRSLSEENAFFSAEFLDRTKAPTDTKLNVTGRFPDNAATNAAHEGIRRALAENKTGISPGKLRVNLDDNEVSLKAIGARAAVDELAETLDALLHTHGNVNLDAIRVKKYLFPQDDVAEARDSGVRFSVEASPQETKRSL